MYRMGIIALGSNVSVYPISVYRIFENSTSAYDSRKK